MRPKPIPGGYVFPAGKCLLPMVSSFILALSAGGDSLEPRDKREAKRGETHGAIRLEFRFSIGKWRAMVVSWLYDHRIHGTRIP